MKALYGNTGFQCITCISVLIIVPYTVIAFPADFPNIANSIQPAVKNGGFKMDGYDLWCPTVIKVGDTYHMFASRWPYTTGLDGWSTLSECVRATSDNLYGPYTFQEVVLHGRSGSWDGKVHNGKIVKLGDTYIIYYIDSAMETGYAFSTSITGPWTRSSSKAMSLKNPAPLVTPDNTLYFFGINKLSDGTLLARGYTAPTWTGPYTLLDNVSLPNNYELEDPCIWWANDQYNMVCNDWDGYATGTFKAGVQYYSTDGHSYILVSSDKVFIKTVTYDDGSTETFRRRERPFMFVNEGQRVTAMFTACLTDPDGPSRIVVNPVDNYFPANPTQLKQDKHAALPAKTTLNTHTAYGIHALRYLVQMLPEGNVSISIYSVKGSLLKTWNTGTRTIPIDQTITSLNGVFIVKVYTNNK